MDRAALLPSSPVPARSNSTPMLRLASRLGDPFRSSLTSIASRIFFKTLPGIVCRTLFAYIVSSQISPPIRDTYGAPARCGSREALGNTSTPGQTQPPKEPVSALLQWDLDRRLVWRASARPRGIRMPL